MNTMFVIILALVALLVWRITLLEGRVDNLEKR